MEVPNRVQDKVELGSPFASLHTAVVVEIGIVTCVAAASVRCKWRKIRGEITYIGQSKLYMFLTRLAVYSVNDFSLLFGMSFELYREKV